MQTTTMPVPLLDLARQHADLLPRFREVFDQCATSGRFVLGPMVDAFEAELAAYCGVEHAIGVSSGTDALIVAMMALGIGPGDEVITSPFTFFATAGSIARVGALPVFADIDPRTFNIDPGRIEQAVTERTRAIMPVHLFGQVADMAAIRAIAEKHSLAVIEDAARAIGARDGDRRAGALGDVGCFSFYPTKNLSAFGDAGAVTTDNPDLAAKMRSIRLHGESSKYHHDTIGGNFRLDALQAGILSVKLPHLDDWAAGRRRNASRYADLLADLPVVCPVERTGGFHVFNQYTLRVPDGRRDALRAHLKARGIGHEVYYPLALHEQPCFAYLAHRRGDFPHAERAADEVLSVPVFAELTEDEQAQVAGAIREFFA